MSTVAEKKEVVETKEQNLIAEEHYRRLMELYRSDMTKKGKTCSPIRVQYTGEYEFIHFKTLLDQAKKSRSKAFHISDIEHVENDIMFSFSVEMNEKNNGIMFKNQTGTFKVHFSDGDFMYFTSWITGIGRDRLVDSLFATEDHVWTKFIKLIQKSVKQRKRPPIGSVYKKDGNTYESRKKLKETPVVHESIKHVMEDMNMFFDNIDQFTRWNSPGTRKVMLVGPPGTGKTSLAVRIAKKFMKEKNVTFFTDINSLAGHLILCAKYSIGTICILEDAEGSLQQADSSLLNFLDGIDQPMNPKGAYVIMTTNHPHKIEPRILQRPGRVDQIFAFGNLKGEYVIKCAEIYLDKFFFGKEKVVKGTKKEIVDGLRELFDADGKGIAGTRIKQFSEDVMKYMISKQKKQITMEDVKTVFNQATDNLKSVYEMAEEQGLLEGDPVGFDFGIPKKKDLKFDEKDMIS